MKKVSVIILLVLLTSVFLPAQVMAVDEPELTVNPTSIDFGFIPTGSSSPVAVVTINNTGSADLNIGQITVTGAHAIYFFIIGDTASNSVLTPGALATFSVVPAVEK